MFTANPEKLKTQNTLASILSGLTQTFVLKQRHLFDSRYELSGQGPNIHVFANKDDSITLSFKLNSLYNKAFMAIMGEKAFDFARSGRNALKANKFDDFKHAAENKVAAYFGSSSDNVSLTIHDDREITLTFNVTNIDNDPLLASQISDILQEASVQPRPTSQFAVNF